MSEKQAVLIVDDRQENLVALRRVLAELDVDVIEATNGNDALGATIGRRFALAILDVQMPGMGGYELAENLRGDDATRVIPIVFVTASYADEQHMFQGYDAGGVDYIVKPFDPKVLLGKARVFLELDRYRQELRRHRDELQDTVAEQTAELQHLNDVLRGIRSVNQLIVRERDRDRLIQSACASLVTQRGYRAAWILLTAADGRPAAGAQHGFPAAGFVELLEEARLGRMPSCCRTDGAIADIVVVDHPGGTCGDCPMAVAHRGDAAMVAVLACDGRRYGWLGVSVPRQFSTGAEETSLLAEMAGDVAFALHGIETAEISRASAERYRALAMQSADCLVLHDTEGNIRDVSQRTCITYGYSREEMLRMTVRDLVPDYDRCVEGGEFYDRMTPGMPLEIETSHRAKDGRVFPVEVRLCPILVGGETLVQCLCRDVSEKQTAKKRLLESEGKYRRLVELLKEGIWAIDAEGITTFANPAMATMLGYGEGEMEGRRLFEFMDKAGAEEAARRLALRRRGVAEQHEFTFLSKDGRQIHTLVSTCPLRDEDGSYQGALASVADLTEIRRIEAERGLMESQLRQAQKLESIGRLAGGVAHDFNNLVMGIMGFADMCREDIGADHPAAHWLDEIRREAQRTANLARQLLAFARKQAVSPQVLNLDDTVTDMLKMLRRLIGEDIELLWRPQAGSSSVKMDPGQIDQILANLCVNARDAIGGVGKVVIETSHAVLDAKYCATHPEADPGEFVVLSVADDGCGMDAATQANIFEPFFTTKAEGEGTGLGLATVYGIVKQNQGSISVHSEVGRGTTFRIFLPHVAAADSGTPACAEQARAEGGTESILLVEDEQSIRRTVRLFLEKAGYTVLAAATPDEALRLIEEGPGSVDLLITDVVMPGMNGRELAERLVADLPGLKVLYMSGYTADVIAHRGVLEKGVAFLAKPVMREELVARVREMLER